MRGYRQQRIDEERQRKCVCVCESVCEGERDRVRQRTTQSEHLNKMRGGDAWTVLIRVAPAICVSGMFYGGFLTHFCHTLLRNRELAQREG